MSEAKQEEKPQVAEAPKKEEVPKVAEQPKPSEAPKVEQKPQKSKRGWLNIIIIIILIITLSIPAIKFVLEYLKARVKKDERAS